MAERAKSAAKGAVKRAATTAAAAAESPFSGASFGGLENGGPVNLSERPFFGKILVRGLGTDSAFLRAAESALGVGLPLEPNTTAALGRGRGEDGEGVVLWLGPSEWLVWTSAREEVLSALDGGLAGVHSAVADVSDYYAVLRLSGGLAREVLAHGCPLDLDGSVFGAGLCAQTRFRAAAILLRCADDSPTYDAQVRWSYAEYLRLYLSEVAALCAAARE